MIFLGDDWAEAHHDIYICDEAGTRLAARRLPEGIEGVTALHELIGVHCEDPAAVVVGIETDRGLWVQSLIEAGYQVYAINPRAASRYRDRHTLSGAKSDPGDAKMLAELVRTDRHNHRLVAGDSDLAEAIKVLARAHQNLIWERTRHTDRLRCALREYFPAALSTFEALVDGDTLAVLAKAPTPAGAARLTPGQVRSALRAGGRTRNIDARAQTIVEGLRVEALAAPEPVVANHASTSPITRASGTRHVALARFVRPTRLADALDQAAFCSMRSSPGARALYDHRRIQGDSHHKALRALANRQVGLLHGCLSHHTSYDETTGWGHRNDHTDQQAA